ncbi:MAG: aminopeptidase [Desulfobacteraceae bacterium]
MNKKEIEKLKKETFKKETHIFDHLKKAETDQAFEMAERYKTFLDKGKTEREAVQQICQVLEKKGFVNMDNVLDKQRPAIHKKYYKVLKGKCVAAAVLGSESVQSGANVVASHIDSPRLDLKQNPLYEDLDLAFLKTHYYGGIKKYQWLSIPLALHGIVVKKDGSSIEICIGEQDDDPVFTVSDLLPHLAGKQQGSKKVSEAFEGEKLNLLCGSIPLGNDTIKERFKLGVLKLLHDQYGMVEADFVSAEIEAVPAFKAKDIGFDRSMIGAYGQDDRICAFSELEAVTGLDKVHRPAVALFFDKEEIGSEGTTGAKSSFIEDFLSDLLFMNNEPTDNRTLRKCLMNSMCLSADVNGALDPDYKEVHEKLNAAKLGYGICITKFTGARGKAGSSDAGAEFVGLIRNLFDRHNILWQTGELGKIDEGGGGTLAKFLAELGMDILDCGPALLSMHSPFEISSKADLYMACKGYRAFYLFESL